mmetsp:Transcript_6186/g.12972  ORF Transcript_6186/g.12972 Transcript_6186/m.12972 type:complete len:328 (-) Transcript_6186:46-1029(-)
MSETLSLRGTLRGHTDWVTSIATTAEDPDLLLSSSRDKSVLVWTLTGPGSGYAGPERTAYGTPKRRLSGHSHFVSDVVISSDGQFALSGSWDGTLRLWEIASGRTTRRFVGHTKDVLSVAFSVDNRQIVSGSRDRSIRLWNTLGECKYVLTDEGHSEWVSCVRFSPSQAVPLIVSCGWDRLVKVWSLSNCTLRNDLVGHSGYLNTVCVSPDGSLCASGGRDGTAMLWDLNEGKRLYSLDAGDEIHCLVFSPNRYWLCAATDSVVKIWDLESKVVVTELGVDMDDWNGDEETNFGKPPPRCISLAWSADGSTLFAGYTDAKIRVYVVG